MTPLDKEVAEWFKGLGYTRVATVRPHHMGFHKLSDDMKRFEHLTYEQATFFYTATKQAELAARTDEAYALDIWLDNNAKSDIILTPEIRDFSDGRIAQLNQSNKDKI